VTWAAEAATSTTRGDRVCTAADYRAGVDREAIARRQRRRQVEDALDEERGREAALAERLDEVVAEQEGPRIDEHVFARMDPADAELVREVLAEHTPFDEEEGDPDYFGAEEDELERAGVDDEIARLHGEVADSQRRQLAFRRYLDALDS
jgi:hypothetical protein